MKKILFYGDSNTYGYDPRGMLDNRYPEDIRWTDRLKNSRDLGWKILVNAMNGREIPTGDWECLRVVEMIRRQAETDGLDWLAVMLGTNDILGAPAMHPAEYVAAKMDHFLQTVTDAFPDLSILVIGPPELGSLEMGDMDWQFSFQAARQMNLLFHLVAEKRGLSYVDAAAWNLPLAYDGVHLSEEGHRVFAAQMEKWLRENN